MDAKPVAVTVQADKPDTGQLIPHGVQGRPVAHLRDEGARGASCFTVEAKRVGHIDVPLWAVRAL
ncbi:hypothetical protein [Micromonospora sp. NPDC005197]|uniref:hypothetical protein n=1 Tax=unclassified Micromonospora TaxID=2617518 RepID=UPI0033A2280E